MVARKGKKGKVSGQRKVIRAKKDTSKVVTGNITKFKKEVFGKTIEATFDETKIRRDSKGKFARGFGKPLKDKKKKTKISSRISAKYDLARKGKNIEDIAKIKKAIDQYYKDKGLKDKEGISKLLSGSLKVKNESTLTAPRSVIENIEQLSKNEKLRNIKNEFKDNENISNLVKDKESKSFSKVTDKVLKIVKKQHPNLNDEDLKHISKNLVIDNLTKKNNPNLFNSFLRNGQALVRLDTDNSALLKDIANIPDLVKKVTIKDKKERIKELKEVFGEELLTPISSLFDITSLDRRSILGIQSAIILEANKKPKSDNKVNSVNDLVGKLKRKSEVISLLIPVTHRDSKIFKKLKNVSWNEYINSAKKIDYLVGSEEETKKRNKVKKIRDNPLSFKSIKDKNGVDIRGKDKGNYISNIKGIKLLDSLKIAKESVKVLIKGVDKSFDNWFKVNDKYMETSLVKDKYKSKKEYALKEIFEPNLELIKEAGVLNGRVEKFLGRTVVNSALPLPIENIKSYSDTSLSLLKNKFSNLIANDDTSSNFYSELTQGKFSDPTAIKNGKVGSRYELHHIEQFAHLVDDEPILTKSFEGKIVLYTQGDIANTKAKIVNGKPRFYLEDKVTIKVTTEVDGKTVLKNQDITYQRLLAKNPFKDSDKIEIDENTGNFKVNGKKWTSEWDESGLGNFPYIDLPAGLHMGQFTKNMLHPAFQLKSDNILKQRDELNEMTKDDNSVPLNSKTLNAKTLTLGVGKAERDKHNNFRDNINRIRNLQALEAIESEIENRKFNKKLSVEEIELGNLIYLQNILRQKEKYIKEPTEEKLNAYLTIRQEVEGILSDSSQLKKDTNIVKLNKIIKDNDLTIEDLKGRIISKLNEKSLEKFKPLFLNDNGELIKEELTIKKLKDKNVTTQLITENGKEISAKSFEELSNVLGDLNLADKLNYSFLGERNLDEESYNDYIENISSNRINTKINFYTDELRTINKDARLTNLEPDKFRESVQAIFKSFPNLLAKGFSITEITNLSVAERTRIELIYDIIRNKEKNKSKNKVAEHLKILDEKEFNYLRETLANLKRT